MQSWITSKESCIKQKFNKLFFFKISLALQTWLTRGLQFALNSRAGCNTGHICLQFSHGILCPYCNPTLGSWFTTGNRVLGIKMLNQMSERERGVSRHRFLRTNHCLYTVTKSLWIYLTLRHCPWRKFRPDDYEIKQTPLHPTKSFL